MHEPLPHFCPDASRRMHTCKRPPALSPRVSPRPAASPRRAWPQLRERRQVHANREHNRAAAASGARRAGAFCPAGVWAARGGAGPSVPSAHAGSSSGQGAGGREGLDKLYTFYGSSLTQDAGANTLRYVARSVNCVEWKAGFIFETPRASIRYNGMSATREEAIKKKRSREKKAAGI
ncbi:hypothetical protein BC826DRAFT_1039398 [Russula brevipes]|nr:hypothetical protein BC826DRAFT_1039398 [Russula brevipes]